MYACSLNEASPFRHGHGVSLGRGVTFSEHTESDADLMPIQGESFILWQHIILTHKYNIKKGINNPSTQELKDLWASLVAEMIKNLPGMQKTQVQSQGQEDPLEKGMATHSGILTLRIL